MNIVKFDFNGHQVGFNGDGWINATEAAKKFNKKPLSWLRQRETVEYLSVLSAKYGKCDFLEQFNKIINLNGDSVASQSKLLSLAKMTGFIIVKNGSPENGGGTWIHPKLAVRFARWLSIDFEIWCDEQIDKLIRSENITYTDEKIIAILTHSKPESWEKRFKDPFYDALAKMTNIPFNNHVGGTPSLFGMITQKWVYQVVLPYSVYSDIKVRLKKGEKIHQFLKPEVLKLVEDQLIAITTIAKGCIDYKDFEARCSTIFNTRGQIKFILAA